METLKYLAILARLLKVGSLPPVSHRLITDLLTFNSFANCTCPRPFSIRSAFSFSPKLFIKTIIPQKWKNCLTSHYNGNIIYLHSTERLGNSSKTVICRRHFCRRHIILHYFTDKAREYAGAERRKKRYDYRLNEIFGFSTRKVNACDVKHRFA